MFKMSSSNIDIDELYDNDIKELKKEKINFEKTLKPFIQQIILWFKDKWSDEHQGLLLDFDNNSSLKKFNSLFSHNKTTRKHIIDHMLIDTDPRDYLDDESMKIFDTIC
jgi:hypothetical protein